MDEAGLGEIGDGPSDAVGVDADASVRNEQLPVLIGDLKLAGDAVTQFCLRQFLATGEFAQDGTHQRLEIRHGHAPNRTGQALGSLGEEFE